MTRDRRHLRKRAFLRAGGAAGAGVVGGTALAATAGPVVGAAGLLAGLGAAFAQLHKPGGVPILVYHSVSPDASWLPWAANTSVKPETLRRHLKALSDGGWTIISTMRFLEDRAAGRALPKRSVILHFDDTYLDNFLFAAPILRDFRAPATFFASTDFIAPGAELRTAGTDPAHWRGYMNAAELRAMDTDPLFNIEAHGTNHGRIPVAGKSTETLSEENWRQHAPLSWAVTEGDKSGWYEDTSPPDPLRLGDPVPANDSALAGRWLRAGVAEDDAAYAARVEGMLREAYDTLGQILGRSPRIFAWPFDRSDPIAIDVAQRVGFLAVTGGRGENRTDEPADILSRVHLQDAAFGGGPVWLEGLAARARANSAAGHFEWHTVSALASRLRKRRFGKPGYGSAS